MNVSPKVKHWLKWHYKLGHLGFEHVRQLGVGSYLDTLAHSFSKTELSSAPKCAACSYGKQARKPDHIKPTSQRPETKGSLVQGQLVPGDRVFTDQLESRVRGRLLNTTGREAGKDKYCASSIFCDAASSYIHVEHQVTLSSTDTIIAKNSFEKMAKENGVTIQEYHTDNGIYQSKAFKEALEENSQAIRFSGVGAKWQNGVAENAIKIVTTRARTMMIHAALHWPEEDDKSLWPLAVSYAAYLYNNTPNLTTGIAPVEVFTGTKSTHQALKNAHVLGMPHLCFGTKPVPSWWQASKMAAQVQEGPVCRCLPSSCREHWLSQEFEHWLHHSPVSLGL